MTDKSLNDRNISENSRYSINESKPNRKAEKSIAEKIINASYIEEYVKLAKIGSSVIFYGDSITITDKGVWSHKMDNSFILSLQKKYGTGVVNFMPNSIMTARVKTSTNDNSCVIIEGINGANIQSLIDKISTLFEVQKIEVESLTFNNLIKIFSRAEYIIINGDVENYILDALFPSLTPFAIISDNIKPDISNTIFLLNLSDFVQFPVRESINMVSLRRSKTEYSRTSSLGSKVERSKVERSQGFKPNDILSNYDDIYQLASSSENKINLRRVLREFSERCLCFISCAEKVEYIEREPITLINDEMIYTAKRIALMNNGITSTTDDVSNIELMTRVTNEEVSIGQKMNKNGENTFMIIKDNFDNIFTERLYQNLKSFCQNGEMRLILSVTDQFYDNDKIILHPWCGIISCCYRDIIENLFDKNNFIISLTFCVRLYVYTEEVKKLIKSLIPRRNIKINVIRFFGLNDKKDQFNYQEWNKFRCMYNSASPIYSWTLNDLSKVSEIDHRISVIHENSTNTLCKIQDCISRCEPFVLAKTPDLCNLIGQDYPLFLKNPSPTRVMEFVNNDTIVFRACEYLKKLRMSPTHIAKMLSE